MKDYEQKYKELVEKLQFGKEKFGGYTFTSVIDTILSELTESEDERIKKAAIEFVRQNNSFNYSLGISKEQVIAWLEKQSNISHFTYDDILALQCAMKTVEKADNELYEQLTSLHDRVHDAYWFEKQGEPRVGMVQWKGDNLREVLEFTGKNKNFDKWFASFEEFEEYVHEHNDIFKIFNEDGSHYEVPVGAWIIKTPDGYNVPSKAKYKQKIEQKPAEWSEDDVKALNRISAILVDASEVKNWWKEYRLIEREEMIRLTDWLKSLKDRVQPQLQQEWNEEDKAILLSVKCVIDNVWHNSGLSDYDEKELQEMWEWLNEIWIRVAYPQPKLEWNEEDEEMISNLIDLLNGGKTIIPTKTYINWLNAIKNRAHLQLKQCDEKDEKIREGLINMLSQDKEFHGAEINWLKSIKPNHWKPSEEQMKALEKECFAHSNYQLCRLLEELEKL